MLNISSFFIIPLVAALLMPFASKLHKRAADALAVLTGLVLVALSVGLVMGWVPQGDYPAGDVNALASAVKLHADELSILFLLVINSIGLACLIYSTAYLDHLGGRAKFYGLFLILMLGLNGVVLVKDLFSLYVYLEVASIASYILVAFTLQFDGIESALKYLLLSVAGTAMILIGIALIYTNVGSLEFKNIHDALRANIAPDKWRLYLLTGTLFVCGFGLKAAIMPFHAWLPDAHPSAPAPVSAILSGVVIKVGGVYSLIRIFLYLYPSTPQIQTVFIILGVVSMAFGAIIAYFQDDIKRMLAYSSISQIGYIMIGLGIGHPWAIAGALFHILNHAQFKSLLFLNSGAIQYRTGTRNMTEMGGLENRMPITSTTSAFGTLSIAGIPPFNGFFSKLLIILGAIKAGYYTVATLAACFSIFTLGYFLIIQRKVFFGKLNAKWKDIKEAPAAMSVSVILLATACLLTGVFFRPIMSQVIEPAAKILNGGN
jgi:multicomponent Na+:H+ antiporter subunit D